MKAAKEARLPRSAGHYLGSPPSIALRSLPEALRFGALHVWSACALLSVNKGQEANRLPALSAW
jgi:hypothetical protein